MKTLLVFNILIALLYICTLVSLLTAADSEWRSEYIDFITIILVTTTMCSRPPADSGWEQWFNNLNVFITTKSKKIPASNITTCKLYKRGILNRLTHQVNSMLRIGETSCRYLGETEKDGQKCRADKVKVHKLPPKCTSFVYNGVMVTSDYNIQYKDDKDDMAGRVCLYDLVHFDKLAKNVYLFFSHGITRDWHHMLINGDYTIVSRKVRIVRNKYYVKGLILDGFHYAYENAVGDMYQNLTDYVKAIKHFDAKLEIGLYLSANTFIKYESKVECIDKDDDWYQPPCNKPYFDFSKMNSIMDFYIIEFHTLNKCITDLLRTGITPLDSSNPHIFSLNYFAALLANSTIDKQKLYFEFLISPIPLTNEIGNFPNCEISYNEYCENKNNKKSKFCADDSEALYQKGKFTKANAKGFIGMYIDLVDRDNNCHCGKYMAFDMMVKRYNGETDPKDCEPLRGS